MISLEKSVLFVCTHGIGDLIMALPTIRLAAQGGKQINLLLKGSIEQQVAEFLLFDISFKSAILANFGHSRLTQMFKTVSWIRKNHSAFAFAQCGVSSSLFAILVFWGGVKCRVGWKGGLSWLNSRSLLPQGVHKVLETARYLDFLDIKFSQRDLQFGEMVPCTDRTLDCVVLAPGSGERESHKRWPQEKYAKLASLLTKDLGVEVVLLGGPDEKELCESIVAETNSRQVLNLAGKCTIRETFERIRTASVVVANCNGVSHMAAAVGTPVVGIYGPTDPYRTGSFAPNSISVSLGLDCSPCYRKGYITGCGKPLCMTNISVETIHSVVVQVIAGKYKYL